ncbi:MAG: CinA family nicotinamide mononucleotide deamidase-related protein [Lentisphaerae bacterium]|nr:CinA family nicotinamide mononucleotide deamidase-related protein [Lentisphaerota bacterium]MCP4100369.1 CinA family nicotinamide mononucleotide deamidase-related protein [Lentisphaerota bacterium]
MRISVICTGTELLKGTTINTNLATIGSALSCIGVVPSSAYNCGDEAEALKKALISAAADSDIIITSGGLGPTKDDMTKTAICEVLGLKMSVNDEISSDLTARWQAKGRTTGLEDMLMQANVPESSEVLDNIVGTAPGLWISGQYKGRSIIAVALPGPPAELIPMLENDVIPRINKLCSSKTFTKSFMIADAAELLVQKKVEPLVENLPLETAYCASVEGVRVFISGSDKKLVCEKHTEVKKLFAKKVLINDLLSLPQDISCLLKERNMTFATAESCTGGMIGASITDLPGSSDIFLGGIISYANEIKHHLLGVPQEILDNKGAVSHECAEAMVRGATKALKTNAAIAVTGIAGPSGGTPEKPVGLVYIAAKMNDKVLVRKCNFKGDRAAIRKRACAIALLTLRELLVGD